jgi:hypothetical protein
MKKILLTLGALIAFSPIVLAQDVNQTVYDTNDDVNLQIITPAEPVKESKEEIKKREKLLREHTNDVAYAKASNSMKRGYFVLTADWVEIGNVGYRRYDISPNSNFVLVQGDDGIIQFAINTGSSGSNGLGGWTGKGTVRNKRIKEKDNGDVIMQYHLVSSKVNADVFITLFHNSNRAEVQITGGYAITMYGEILPYRDKNHR